MGKPQDFVSEFLNAKASLNMGYKAQQAIRLLMHSFPMNSPEELELRDILHKVYEISKPREAKYEELHNRLCKYIEVTINEEDD